VASDRRSIDLNYCILSRGSERCVPRFNTNARCLTLVPALLGSFALMTSFLASFWCETVAFPPAPNSAVQGSMQFGPWYQNQLQESTVNVGGETKIFVSNVCVQFPSGTYIDPKLKAVRAFSIIVTVLGGLMTFGLWLAPCFYRHTESSWRCCAIFFLVFITLFQGLTFLLYASSFCDDNPVIALQGFQDSFETNCVWDQGTTCNVISTVLWFLTGACMILQGAPRRPPPEPTETQAVTYQKTTNPDGTATVAQVAVVKGVAVPSSKPNQEVPERPVGFTPDNKLEEV
jgi:hypothetical protein